MLECEQLLKVFFSENGTKADLLRTLEATSAWAEERLVRSLAVGRPYLDGEGPFPERGARLDLTARFVNDFYLLVLQWATWAAGVVATWPDDIREAKADRAILEETYRRIVAVTGER